MKLPSASDLNDKARKFAEEGKTLFQSAIGRIDLFSSVKAYEADKSQERIESHYVLVPFRKSESGFVLYTMRTVPKGWQRISELPEKKIFHFAKPEHRNILEDLIFKEKATDQSSGRALDELAKEIDTTTESLTGSMLLIGSAILFFNPLVGGIVLLSSIVPSVGGTMINKSVQVIGEKLSVLKNRKTSKISKKEIKKMEPEVCINPLLGLALDTFHQDQSADFSPIEDDRMWPKDTNDLVAYRVVGTAIHDIYQPYLKNKRNWKEVGLNQHSVDWIVELEVRNSES